MRGVIDKLASRLTGFRMVGILLRPRRHGPRQRRAAEQHDELAALHVWMAPAWQELRGSNERAEGHRRVFASRWQRQGS